MYYPSSENKGADQLRGDREADLRLCFRICKMFGFSRSGSFVMIGLSHHYLLDESTLIFCFIFKLYSWPQMRRRKRDVLFLLRLICGKIVCLCSINRMPGLTVCGFKSHFLKDESYIYLTFTLHSYPIKFSDIFSNNHALKTFTKIFLNLD